MPLFAPVLKGYTPYLPAESGLAPGTVEGRLGNTESITSFSYSKDINRRFSASSFSIGSALRGQIDVQIVESKEPGAKLLFDQAVDLGALFVAASDPFFGSGIGLYDWFFYTDESDNSSQGKFKTRVISGQHVPVKLEKQTPDLADWPAIVPPAPERPGVPLVEGQKSFTLVVRMPALPARAASFSLLLAPAGSELDPAAPEERFFTPAFTQLLPDQIVEVPCTLVGASQVEKMWMRLLAVGPDGQSLGPAMRDCWARLSDSSFYALDRGYEGYRFVDTLSSREPIPLDEYGTAINETGAQVSTGGFMFGLFWTRPYKCELPPGAVMRVRSDAWGSVPAVIRNKFTFAFSYKVGGVPPQFLRDPRVGTTWLFHYKGASLELRCARHLRLEGFNHEKRNFGVIYTGAITAFQAARYGASLFCVFDTGVESYLSYSYNEGGEWHLTDKLFEHTRILGSCLSVRGDTFYVLGVATASLISNDPALSEAERQVNQGDVVRVILRKSQTETGEATWKVASRTKVRAAIEGDTLPNKNVSPNLQMSNGQIMVASVEGDYMRLHVSTDELASLARLSTPDAGG